MNRAFQKYNDGGQFTITDLKKIRKQPNVKRQITLKNYDTWDSLSQTAKSVRIELLKEKAEKEDLPPRILKKISRTMPDLAVRIANTKNLRWEQFRDAVHALGPTAWKDIEHVTYPTDKEGSEWLLRKAINMQDSRLYRALVESDSNVKANISNKLKRKSYRL
jgi:hypothetical protein